MARQPRYLAPWRRTTADLHLQLDKAREALGFESPEAAEEYLAALKGKPAIYHCVSRVVDRRRVLGAAERTKFVDYMREYEAFCQVRVLTFCVMSNHFHILVEIPEAPQDRGRSWSDEEFLRHISCRYHGKEFRRIAGELARWREQGVDSEAEKLRDRHFARMWDLSWFLRLLKQRFTQWYNWRKGRDGHLWSDRFKSVLVESGRAARIMAAYIDLNPVRAGMVEDPAAYAWSGWGEAMAGGMRAREGLRLVVFEFMAGHSGAVSAAKSANTWRKVASRYRWMMFLGGEETADDERKGRAGIPTDKVADVLEEEGLAEEAALLRRRTPLFCNAKVLGGSRFVEEVGAFRLGWIPSPRTTWKEEQAVKAMQLNVLGGSGTATVAG